MKKTLRKDVFRLVKNTKGRFLSLTAIVAIGVSFFVGVSAGSPLMADSVDTYDDETNLKDITIYSDYGFDQKDVDAVQNLDDVERAEGTVFVDVNAASDTDTFVTRVHSWDPHATINQFELVSGRLPENTHEVLAEGGTELNTGFALGSTVTLSRPDDDLSDWLNVDTVTVVGLINTPLYLNETKENSTLSNQYIRTYLYIPIGAFNVDYYTELNVLIKGGSEMNSFSDAYKDYSAEVKQEIIDLGTTEISNRRTTVLDKANSEYQDGLDEYNDAVQTYNDEIADAEQEISDSEQEIKDGEQEIADGEQTLKDSQKTLDEQEVSGSIQINEARAELAKGQETLDEGKEEFAAKKEQYLAQKDQLNTLLDGLTQLQDGRDQLAAGITQIQTLQSAFTPLKTAIDAIPEDQRNAMTVSVLLQAYPALQEPMDAFISYMAAQDPSVTIGGNTTLSTVKAYLDPTLSALDLRLNNTDSSKGDYGLLIQQANLNTTISNTLTGLKAQYPDLPIDEADLDQTILSIQGLIDQIDSGLASGQAEIDAGQKKIDDGYQQCIDASGELVQQVQDAQKEIDDGWVTLNENKQTLEDGKQELEDSKKDGQQKLDDAKADLDKAKQDIDDLQDGEWTVLDRTEHYASATFNDSVTQMKAIAAIFPVFFFMVAALVCLTTMTRMVDEQRGQIGILRALGFTQGQCAEKYLLYASAATLFGCLIGNVLGLMIFPGVIYNAWKMMYILPDMVHEIPWNLILISNFSFLGVMALTTWYACRNDMKEVPSQLMRPKAPKLGKSTIIERIPILWNHLSFTWKVTIRNLIRYKKRLFMTVIGVGGCTALLITGYGIRDSITTIVDTQFSEIYQYDGIIKLDSDVTASEAEDIAQTFADRDDVSSSTLISYYSGKAYGSDGEKTVRTEVYTNAEDIQKTYNLRNYYTKDPITLDDTGVVISQKLSNKLNAGVGDTIEIESSTGVRAEVKVTGVCEMYIYHYAFMTQNYYDQVFGVNVADNAVLVKCSAADSTALQKDAVAVDGVSGIEFYDVLKSNFNSMVVSLDVIVVVLIISSLSLAVVVLGNLTNVNISERQREIATLKVLGFRKKEVENYIYKENNVLTLIGSLVGIPLGQFLHHYIMSQVEMDYVMFGRNVFPQSILVCVLMTIGFGMLVNFLMRKKLHQITMVESLKSVE